MVTLGIGGLIGFMSAVGKDFLLENSKNKAKLKDFKRQKLEEIFMIMDKISQEAVKPLKLKNQPDGIGSKLGMLIRFYFPELQDDYSKFLQVFQATAQKTMSYDENAVLTVDEMKNYYEAHREFLNRVVKVSEKYI